MKKIATRWFSGLLAAALALTLCAGLPTVLATPASAKVTQADIDKLKGDAQNIAADRKALKEQMAAVAADKSKALERKNLVDQQINAIQAQIDNLTQQIAVYDGLIADKTEELHKAEEEEAKQYDLFCKRVRMMEEEGEVSYWSILFNSSDFSDLLDRFMMVEEIMDYDNAIMDQLIAIRQKIETDKADLEKTRADQQAAKDTQVAAKAELKPKQDEANRILAEIQADEATLKEAERRLQAAAAAMDSEIRRKEKELAAQMAASGTNIVSEKGFKWPSYATKLTSLYGGRIHPISGKPSNHTGIDIAAAGGTDILAAKSGVVLTSTYNNSYGNYVVVSHGNGQTTLYAHMRKRAVSEGQTVKQGQTLGYVGTTGSSNGNHLHFEVRINGSRVDPLNYFKGSTFSLLSGGKYISYKVK